MRRLAAVSLVAATAAAAAFLLDGEPAKPKAKDVPTAKAVVGYVNHQRALRELPRLSVGSILERGSRTWSARVNATGSFVHASLTPTGRFSWIAEVLYRGPGGPVRPWLNSPPHRAILLSPKARLVGVGRSGNIWTARFARAH